MGSFHEECDRVSRIADPHGFDALEWAKSGGRTLAEAVELTKAMFDDRDDLTIKDVPTDNHRARLTLSTSEARGLAPLVDINFSVSGESVVIWATAAEGSKFTITGNKHHSPGPGAIEADWIEGVLSETLASLN